MMTCFLLAVALSSPEIGNFFQLPSWMPTSVSSHDTIGSDPDDGTGWYILEECYTNSTPVFGEWKVTVHYDGGDTTYSGHVTWDETESGWNVDSVPYDLYRAVPSVPWGEHGSILHDPSFVFANRDVTNFTWTTEFFRDYVIFGTVDCEAARTKETHLIYWTNCVPRAVRLTPDMSSSVNATFEAYCERQYYALCGQSNEWRVATYGPKHNKKRFLYDPLTNEYEFVYAPAGTNAIDRKCETNRTILTRRLLEYDNIKRLGEFITDSLVGHDFNIVGEHRPGWIFSTPVESGHHEMDGSPSFVAYDTSDRAWWTTRNGVFESPDIIPTFSWTTRPEIYNWADKAVPFSILSSRDGSVWTINQNRYNTPNCVMMTYLLFSGSNVCFSASDIAPTNSTLTMEDVLADSYPHCDPYAITNLSRRLISKKIETINHLLGVLDRSYYVPIITYPISGTNFMYSHSLSVTASTNVNPSAGIDEIDISNMNFSFASETTNVSSEAVNNESYSIIRAISGTTTDSKASASCEGVCYTISDSDILNMIGSIPASISSDYDFTHLVEISGATISGDTIHILATVNGVSVDLPARFVATNAPLTVTISCKREYSYARTYGSPGVMTTQPGSDAITDGVVYKMDYGIVRGYYAIDGSDQVIPRYLYVYNEYDSDARWRSDQRTYATRQDILDELSTVEGEFHQKFAFPIQADFTDPESYVPIDESQVGDAKNGVTIEMDGPTVGICEPTALASKKIVVYVKKTDSAAEFTQYLDDGSVAHSTTAAVFFRMSGEASVTVPRLDERRSRGLSGRVGITQRTDWNWRALHRGATY